MRDPRSKSTRRTSKVFLLGNTLSAWVLAFYGVYAGQGAAVVASALSVVGLGYGAYVGVGHLDYRRFLNFFTEQGETPPPDALGNQELEADDPGREPVGFVRPRDHALSKG